MNLVHVVPTLIKGGGERVAVLLANEAAKSGHNVTIIAASPVDPAQLEDSLHPNVAVAFVSSAAGSRASRYTALPLWLLRRRKWLAQQDIVHCHLTYGAVFGTALKIMRKVVGAKRPVLVETYHAIGMPIPPFKRWVHAQLAARRDALALMGWDAYWGAFALNHPELLTKIIPNGVSDPAVASIGRDMRMSYRREIGIPDDATFIVGTVGMLRPDRRPDVYIPVFAEIARALGPLVHFVIAGSGSERDRMEALIKQHRLEDRIHLPGLVLEPRLPLSIMDLYVTLNVGAVTGLAAMEAAFAGVPVIAVQLNGGYQPDSDDWIWSSTSATEVAGRAVELLRSRGKRETLARRQGDYVQAHHSIDAMVRSYASLYDAAINRTRPNTVRVHNQTAGD